MKMAVAAAVPTQGAQAGIVRHDLWTGGANYVEEPIFPGRVYRDYLWFNDKKFLEASFEKCERALNQVYNRGHYGFLVSSVDGNQSYDCWKMPGASAYVNSAWVFSLYAMERMSKILGKPAYVAGIQVDVFASDSEQLYLSPFKNFAFSLENITLAGVRLTVVVEKDWNTVWVDGKKISGGKDGWGAPVGVFRGKSLSRVEFSKISEG